MSNNPTMPAPPTPTGDKLREVANSLKFLPFFLKGLVWDDVVQKLDLACKDSEATLRTAATELDELVAAFDKMRMVSLPPHDVSGQNMWNEAMRVRDAYRHKEQQT